MPDTSVASFKQFVKLERFFWPCHFLKGDMNYKVPVTRYLGFTQRQCATQMLQCLSSQILGHGVGWGVIMGISPFRK